MQAYWLEDKTSPEISAAELLDNGVFYQRLDCVSPERDTQLNSLAQERGYVDRDEVTLDPQTPELDALCDKFAREHAHDDDEVRYVLGGRGIFDIRCKQDRWMRVEVETGDLIIVPAGRFHRFFLTSTKNIHCVRLYKDTSGWTPHYRSEH